ncbi:AraC family transcriptional regulator [Phenylobacterium sp. LjRoot225]|uniref:AraC family transcriptional regulator n=1 Tax=Phenylobacterium sp. LjRoot225 TaxID=3342285 RepID=UPI003ED10F21
MTVMQNQLDDLRALAARHARGPLHETAIPGVAIHTRAAPSEPQPLLFAPTFFLVLQGAKEAILGERRLRYDRHTYAVASMEVAGSGCVIEASAAEPYIGLSLRLDRESLATLLPDAPQPEKAATPPAFAVSPVTPELVDAFLRLLHLLDRPGDIPVLAPLLQREILYRLLQGPQAAMLRQLALVDSRSSQVRRAIAWIRDNYAEPLRVGSLAALAGMSPASFHRHFKAATAMSPLQFQKSLRLQHARRLLLGAHDATQAAYAVGYESASQFSREYARLFGAPPSRDAQRLRSDFGRLADVSVPA